MDELKTLRDEWEKDLREVACKKLEGLVVYVGKDKNGKYHCHRYFTIALKWEVSADYQALSDHEAVMRWLTETLA